ncbi:DMT family transporter [Ferrimonas marina]|uniref:DMT family transporter n=1 Tax=Ferrimonas marina TaxID=299255 RepID=UPI001F1984C8|nr:DMT family transporter [Ferrimonas marina]
MAESNTASTLTRAGLTRIGLTLLALLAFAGNSVLCRLALKSEAIDPAAFTLVRLISAALTLGLLLAWRQGLRRPQGRALGGALLFLYAIAFSFAYITLDTGTGALLLFGSVQITMLALARWRGQALTVRQLAGSGLALLGLVVLVWPDLSLPGLLGSGLMILAGAAWGGYTLLGRGSADPLGDTAWHFFRTLPWCLGLALLSWPYWQGTTEGIVLALISGAVTSGLGYALWYRVLPGLGTSTAATVQLLVPILAALGGSLFAEEPLTLTLLLASLLVLGGLALVIRSK